MTVSVSYCNLRNDISVRYCCIPVTSRPLLLFSGLTVSVCYCYILVSVPAFVNEFKKEFHMFNEKYSPASFLLVEFTNKKSLPGAAGRKRSNHTL